MVNGAYSLTHPLDFLFFNQNFKAEVHPHIVEMQQLNQEMTALRNTSPIAAETLQKPVKQANEKWADLLKGVTDREVRHKDYNDYGKKRILIIIILRCKNDDFQIGFQ